MTTTLDRFLDPSHAGEMERPSDKAPVESTPVDTPKRKPNAWYHLYHHFGMTKEDVEKDIAKRTAKK